MHGPNCQSNLSPPPPLRDDQLPFIKVRLQEVITFYERLVARAAIRIENGELTRALHTIFEAAKIAYLLNWRYQDQRLEKALATVGKQLVPFDNRQPSTEERIVFFDSWGKDNRGLSLQYLRALKNTVPAFCSFARAGREMPQF